MNNLIFGDDKNLIVDYANGKSLRLTNPLVKNIQWTIEQPHDCCWNMGRDPYYYLTGPLTVELTMNFVGCGVEYSDRIPNLKELAKKLTICELFEIIQEKLKERE